jgi:hypothetical protein
LKTSKASWPSSIPPLSRRAEVVLLLGVGRDVVPDPAEELAGGGALGEALDHRVGDELRHPPGVELAEVLAVAGQHALRDELQQHRVVALEGGEDLRVGLARAEVRGGQIAETAAGLAAGLDRLDRVPGGDRLDAGRP